ncbi:class II aldolase/adducin family protein [Cohnella thailandensis]|uniref:Class II aldolase/adducin family protein n=1 Tax=Cohnella thailandensis TaxID=557557 RepID=A0A841SQU5_9BACL|nr:class II aldolase/adducin family protein [Cohnella thailandensis]MBB6634783.1 class II aldolase/adducin family protein [Cohnella thailandensis]MBP1975996.1 ribulose-5-phosphate 4-epimerase/fuculose-1-phosphate aldolase [Cohnella thailandensis]
MAIDAATINQQPIFSNLEDERQHRKERLAAAFRVFAKLGYEEGVMGHISARDPIKTDHYWTNPFGLSFGLIKTSDLVLMGPEGKIASGHGLVHPGGIQLHLPILRDNPHIQSAAHTHSIYGRTWSAFGRLLDPLTAEAAVFHNRHVIYDSFAHGEGDNLAQVVGNNKAVLLKNHGILSLGKTVDETAYWFISFEKASQGQLLAEAAGKPLLIGEKDAEAIAARTGEQFGWLNFQPYYQAIVREQPDLLN